MSSDRFQQGVRDLFEKTFGEGIDSARSPEAVRAIEWLRGPMMAADAEA